LASNPGVIFNTIDIPLPRPRVHNSFEYQEIEQMIENAFGELLLDKDKDIEDHFHAKDRHDKEDEKEGFFKDGPYGRQKRVKPIINTSLTLIEGLISRLSSEVEPMDLYDLCEDMGHSVDQVLPAVAGAEALGFLTTPGICVILTDAGRHFAAETNAESRSYTMQKATLTIPLVSAVYKLVQESGEDGIDAEYIQKHIVHLLPFEDSVAQFNTLIRWCRHSNLLVYDADTDKIHLPQ
jgi:NitT/TauT family transport system ATP-binding protein